MCKSQGEIFVNMYDFGALQNFKRFFNIGEQYPWYTFFLPIPIPPKVSGESNDNDDLHRTHMTKTLIGHRSCV